MTRPAVHRVASARFDLLVVGGGVHGAFAAWDAALRGYSVALIDRADFGGAASWNSLKILHGGFRHLQRAQFGRLRASARERDVLAGASPHLVRALPCVLPTSGGVLRGKRALAAALALYERLVARSVPGARATPWRPRGRVIERDELRMLLGSLAPPHATAGALWFDGVLQSSERYLMAVIRSAVDAGATACNYVEATDWIRQGSRVVGARCLDRDTGDRFEIRARMTLDATGARAFSLSSTVPSVRSCTAVARARNVVLANGPLTRAAVALPHPSEPRLLFAVPWRERLMLGTSYSLTDARESTLDGDSQLDTSPVPADLAAVIAGPAMAGSSVTLVHSGYLAADTRAARNGSLRLLEQELIIDHERTDATPGLVTMLGPKWTTARLVAQRAVDLCQQRLGGRVAPGGTDRSPLWGGDMDSAEDYLSDASCENEAAASRISRSAMKCLRSAYGTQYREVLQLARAADRPELLAPLETDSGTIGAQVIHAIRQEQALHLTDILLRRTDLGARGAPSEGVLSAAAKLAAVELGWSPDMVRSEVSAVRNRYTGLREAVDDRQLLSRALTASHAGRVPA